MTTLLVAVLGAGFGLGLAGIVLTLSGHRLVPDRLAAPRAQLDRIAKRLLVGVIVGAALGALTGWPVLALGALLLVLAWPWLFGTSEAADIERIEAIAAWVESVRDTIAGGAGLQQALVASSELADGPLAPALGRFAARAQRSDLAEALVDLSEELGDPSADRAIAGLVVAARMDAADLVSLLTLLGASIRDEVSMRRRVYVSRQRIRTSGVLITVVVFATGGLMFFMPGDLTDAYDDLAGQLWLLLVLGVMGLGWYVMRRMSELEVPARFQLRRAGLMGEDGLR